jgi:LmbE family N-acetylglucosaminyl deacetylase
VRWLERLAAVPEVDLPAGRIVVVAPHPDDETLGAGGLIARAAREGREVRVVACTDGEAAYPGVTGLAAVRRAELVDALDALAAPGRVDVDAIGLPDGDLASHESELGRRIAAASERAALVVGPWSEDGHPDHEAAARACAAAAGDALRWSYPVWAWHFAAPDELPLGRAVRVGLDDVDRSRRVRAIGCHRSQLAGDLGPPIVTLHLLAHIDRPFDTFLVDAP